MPSFSVTVTRLKEKEKKNVHFVSFGDCDLWVHGIAFILLIQLYEEVMRLTTVHKYSARHVELF